MNQDFQCASLLILMIGRAMRLIVVLPCFDSFFSCDAALVF